MNLKEAYQYQNYIGVLFGQTLAYLQPMYVTTTTRTHYKSKAINNIEDEVINESLERPFGDVSVDALIDFAAALIEEKVTLGAAITDAKYNAKITYFDDGIDLDAELSANKSRHSMVTKLQTLAEIKPKITRKSSAKDYCFNAEGNQTSYTYPIEDVVTIDFDRDHLKSILKDLKETSMNKSMRADKAMLDTKVSFEPSFDINDSYADTLKAFITSIESEITE